VGTPTEKCDYGPTVDAKWRLVGESAWSPDPDLPTGATAEITITYFVGEPKTLDEPNSKTPGLSYTTNGASFPAGQVDLEHEEFFYTFQDSFFEEADVWSLLQARVSVPMADIATFTEHEYQITFASQTFVAGHVAQYSVLEAWMEWLFGGSDEE
jgi:hypothetical protein